MIVIISGAPGSGKTKTAEYLVQTTPNSAWIDGDWMLRINPQKRNTKEIYLRMKNISDIVKNYNKSGYSYIFISFVYMGSKVINDQKNMFSNIDTVRFFALVPDDNTLRNRHDKDTYEREEIESSIKINRTIANLENVTVIDNSNLSIEEVAKKITQAI